VDYIKFVIRILGKLFRFVLRN